MIEEMIKAWMNQLEEIKRLQRGIVAQQSQADENLEKLKKSSAVILQKVDELGDAMHGRVRNISPELEAAIKVVSARATSIDEQVPDVSPKTTQPPKKGK